MNNVFGFGDLYTYIWIIPLLASIHEIEEWNILKWYQKYYKNLPGSTNTSIRIHIIVFCLVYFLLTGIAYLARETFLFSLIIAFLSSFLLYNFIQHVIWTVQFRAYSVGLTTSFLCMYGVILVNMELIQNDLFSIPFYLLALLFIAPVIGAVKAKGEMTKEVLNVHRFFIRVEKVINGLWHAKE